MNGEQDLYQENGLIVTPEFFDVFTFDFVEGSNEDKLAPQSVFIPLSLARKLFGNELIVVFYFSNYSFTVKKNFSIRIN